jgi:DNA-binding response OmpR family regulator
MKIALLEDEPDLATYMDSLLTEAGHECHAYQSGRRLMNVLHQETFDVVVLDWNVPDLSGLEILQWMRESLKKYPPTLLVTSRNSEEDAVKALAAGADDFIVKPIIPQVFLARLEAIRRRNYPDLSSNPVRNFGLYQFNLLRDTVTLQDKEINLTAKEFQLALLLFSNLHRAMSRSFMFETIWGMAPDLPTRTLDVHMSKVRLKLDLHPRNGFKLTPLYAYGYRLEQLELESS